MSESEQRLIEAMESLTRAIEGLRSTIERSGGMSLETEAPAGLEPIEQAILRALSDPDPRHAGQYDRKEVTHLAQRLDLEPEELNRYLDGLQKGGFLERYPATRERDGRDRVRRVRQSAR